uniref:Agenet domain-containing protein n=1 Tax=Davidia involucrata TaxID=16924 RepID=A0A5B7BNL7_DAVIN
MGEDCFKKGAEVEVSFEEEGFRGSWYTATVVRTVSKKNNKIFVEFHNLMADEKGTKPLREFVNAILVRPVPPREANRSFKFSEEVDAFHNDGWWEGVVTAVLEDSRYSVFFRSSREQIDFRQSDLRLHREWVHGKWDPPLDEESQS